MYDVNAWVVGVEEPGNKYICRRFGWKLREDLGLCRSLLRAVEECNAWRMFVALGSFVSLQLLVVLLLMLGEIVLDF
jgi:hypothetical protein